MMITAYSLGFAIPFYSWHFYRKHQAAYEIFEYAHEIGGALMIVIGILLYTDNMIWMNIWYSNLTNLFLNNLPRRIM